MQCPNFTARTIKAEPWSLLSTFFHFLTGTGMPMGPLPVLNLAASAAVGYLLAPRAHLESLFHLEAIDAKVSTDRWVKFALCFTPASMPDLLS